MTMIKNIKKNTTTMRKIMKKKGVKWQILCLKERKKNKKKELKKIWNLAKLKFSTTSNLLRDYSNWLI